MMTYVVIKKRHINVFPCLPETVSRDLPYYPYCLPERRRLTSEHSNTMRRKKNESSWNIHKNYSCVVQSVSKLNVDPGNGATVSTQYVNSNLRVVNTFTATIIFLKFDIAMMSKPYDYSDAAL